MTIPMLNPCMRLITASYCVSFPTETWLQSLIPTGQWCSSSSWLFPPQLKHADSPSMSLRQYEMTCLTKKAGSIWLCRRLPPAFLCVFCNCVCPPFPWSIYADSPTEIFPRGCYISIFYIQLSAFHLPTQFVLLLLFDCDIFKLPVIFNLYLFGV